MAKTKRTITKARSDLKIVMALPRQLTIKEKEEILKWWRSLSTTEKQFIRLLADEWMEDELFMYHKKLMEIQSM